MSKALERRTKAELLEYIATLNDVIQDHASAIKTLSRRATEAEQTVRALRWRHKPVTRTLFDGYKVESCSLDDEKWPCKSSEALDAAVRYGKRLGSEVFEEEVSTCIRDHQCATEGQGPCNGLPR